MKYIARIIIALFMGLLLSINDFAWPADPACTELFSVVAEEQDQDGNTSWGIIVTPYMQANGTDSMCQAFGQCVLDLIASAPGMGSVEIVNPENEWVPSARRYIEVRWAMVLAGVADIEEQAYMNAMAFNLDYDD